MITLPKRAKRWIGIGFGLLFLYGAYLSWVKFGARYGTHPFPDMRPEREQGTYVVGSIQLGSLTFPVRCDSTEWRRETVVRVVEVKRVDTVPSWGTRLGTPAFYAVLDGAVKGGRIWRLSTVDFNKLPYPQKGKTYKMAYGHRDAWAACTEVWNVLAFEEVKR